MEKLSSIGLGKEVIIHSLSKDEANLKLMEMGIIPGEKIKIIHIAPMGDPITIVIGGTTLSLRISEANNIIVNN